MVFNEHPLISFSPYISSDTVALLAIICTAVPSIADFNSDGPVAIADPANNLCRAGVPGDRRAYA